MVARKDDGSLRGDPVSRHMGSGKSKFGSDGRGGGVEKNFHVQEGWWNGAMHDSSIVQRVRIKLVGCIARLR